MDASGRIREDHPDASQPLSLVATTLIIEEKPGAETSALAAGRRIVADHPAPSPAGGAHRITGQGNEAQLVLVNKRHLKEDGDPRPKNVLEEEQRSRV